jgi:hypothetical protein
VIRHGGEKSGEILLVEKSSEYGKPALFSVGHHNFQA